MNPTPPDARARLMQALKQIARPVLLETSVKASAQGLAEGRCLISFPRQALGPGPKQRLRSICASLGAPEPGFAALDALQGQAVSVHFGLEPNPEADVFKCYLEFPRDALPQRDLVFLALKWRVESGQYNLSRYWSRDHLAAAQQQNLLQDITPAGAAQTAVAALMQSYPARQGPRLLEVDEAESPRRSLDLNLAEQGVSVQDCTAILLPFLGGTAEAKAYLTRHAKDRLGHVALGCDKAGQAFATLYHGAHRVSEGLI